MRHATVRTATPYGFLLPAMLVTGACDLVPGGCRPSGSACQDYILYDPDDAQFVGLRQFRRRRSRTRSSGSRSRTRAVWIAGVVGLQFLLGLGAALLLNQSFWWRGLARALIVIPWALPSVIIGADVDLDVRFQCRRHQRSAAARWPDRGTRTLARPARQHWPPSCSRSSGRASRSSRS